MFPSRRSNGPLLTISSGCISFFFCGLLTHEEVLTPRRFISNTQRAHFCEHHIDISVIDLVNVIGDVIAHPGFPTVCHSIDLEVSANIREHDQTEQQTQFLHSPPAN